MTLHLIASEIECCVCLDGLCVIEVLWDCRFGQTNIILTAHVSVAGTAIHDDCPIRHGVENYRGPFVVRANVHLSVIVGVAKRLNSDLVGICLHDWVLGRLVFYHLFGDIHGKTGVDQCRHDCALKILHINCFIKNILFMSLYFGY